MSAENKPSLALAYKRSKDTSQEIIYSLEAKYGIKLFPVETVPPENNLPLLRVTKQQLVLEHQQQTLFFHPSMALLRMINIRRGIGDRFLEATNLTKGDFFLDATMGLASDTLIASWAVGDRGKVLALEYSPLLFMLVQEGLEQLRELQDRPVKSREKQEAWLELAEASSRIEAFNRDHRSVLEGMPDSSVDVIYFDPMFRETVSSSSSIKPLKDWSYTEPLTLETIREACRAARKRVVLKERKESGEFQRLGFEQSAGGKYSSINFGIIDLTKLKGEKPCSP